MRKNLTFIFYFRAEFPLIRAVRGTKFMNLLALESVAIHEFVDYEDMSAHACVKKVCSFIKDDGLFLYIKMDGDIFH
jgi:hypothetical protein